MIARQEARDGVGPFDDGDSIRVIDGLLQILRHEARVGEAIKIIMNETLAIRKSVLLRNGKARTSNGLLDSQPLGEAAHKGGLASADITDELDNNVSGRVLPDFSLPQPSPPGVLREPS